ncbi:Uncharacterized protein MSYG_3540 [Malassezia sympodialis ATCC 42132]|uniref:Chalcone isomerase domain-containing protein n=1 Tax=Malassezia sympodialis (strain ATCC 42132) TaxID=1230383 RepID=A0A1M8A9U1_MALS4|nr:Uncharacterized protein MSYG_3540 [Malassezia sympodialis ATCC 42132]
MWTRVLRGVRLGALGSRSLVSAYRKEFKTGYKILPLALAGVAASTVALYPRTAALEASHGRLVTESKSSMDLPVYIKTDSTMVSPDGVQLRLVGMGVRTVTFLGVYVYVAALYVEEKAIAAAKPAWATGGQDLEAQVRSWIEEGTACAVRVMPVRSTDFSHLRDGLLRTVQTRAKDARLPGTTYTLDEASEDSVSQNVQDLKKLFPRSKVSRGQTLDLVVEKAQSGSYVLTLQHNGCTLGHVQSAPSSSCTFTVPTGLLLAYMGERPDISAALRASVVAGLQLDLP